MNANEMTFGIEIECYLPREAIEGMEIGAYHRGVQVQGLPAGWNAQHDGSLLLNCPQGYTGVEIVSPVLKGLDGIEQIRTVCQWLNARGAKVNKSTGLHVHVGIERSPENMKRVVTAAANFEKAIYASTGTKSREQGHYCQPIHNSQRHISGQYARTARYHVLNVMTNKPTVEFRAFAGTTNFTKIVVYVRLSIGIVERALEVKKLPQWTAKQPVESSPIARGGEGLTALNRLFYWLGWTAGRVNKVYGAVGAEVLPVKEQKAELVRLAKKYDERG